ncbi:MAG: SMI1/KNR4 family protein, partial [Acetatifactor sp.]|nr:SMI1/KNR4 family protein [Acetatifactor sp.]
ELYRFFDGEGQEETGFMAGFRFLSLKGVIYEYDFFKGLDEELTAMGTKAVKDAPLSELCYIPFAFDSSRAFLVVDLSPADGGKYGQIVAVDYDTDRTYLLADDMDEFFGRMTAWLDEGILIVSKENREEAFLMEASGHLFNSLEELSIQEKSSETEIALPEGFWQERYKDKKVAKNVLDKVKTMLLTDKTVDCVLFGQMDNLKELIFHDCRLEHIEGIAKAQQLKKLIFARCTFDGEDLSALSQAPALKELSLNVMDASGLTALTGVKTLRSLSIREVTGIRPEEVEGFGKLQELSIENMGLHDGGFLGELKNLKKLDLHWHVMDNLDFLPVLTKLTEFHLAAPAASEEGLSAIKELTKLKEFIYPVRDLKVYAGHPNLEQVGMAAGGVQGFEAFAGSKVNSFMVCGSLMTGGSEDEEMERIAANMKQYVKIYSYGRQGTPDSLKR